MSEILNCFRPSVSLDRSVLSILRFSTIISLTQNKQCQDKKIISLHHCPTGFYFKSLPLNALLEGTLSSVCEGTFSFYLVHNNIKPQIDFCSWGGVQGRGKITLPRSWCPHPSFGCRSHSGLACCVYFLGLLS